jgi:hypothetical protein
MKQLTLDLYERIIDAVYEKSKHSPDMEIGDGTRHNCAEYIAFYAIHNELFWSEQDGKICGIATFHPGRSDFSWNWSDFDNGIWTLHLVWAENIRATADMLIQFLSKRQHPVTELWTCRNDGLVAITEKKLKRLFLYGKRRNYNQRTSSTKLSGVHAVNPAIAD